MGRNFVWMFYTQTRALIIKNFIQAFRSWKGSVVIYLAPIALCVLMFVLQLALNNLLSDEQANTPTYNAAKIPKCTPWNGKDCISFAYAPAGVAWVDQLAAGIALESDLVMGVDVVGYATLNALRNYSLSNQNVTQAGVSFTVNLALNGSVIPQNVSYLLVLNITTTEFDVAAHAQRAVDNAILKTHYAQNPSLPEPDFALRYGDFPKAKRRRVGGGSIVASTGSLWFFSSTMIVIIQFLASLVYDKQYKLRNAMYAAGLSRAAYWTSSIITQFIFHFFQILVLFAIGAALQIEFFLYVNYGVLFVIFVCFAMSMVPLAMFLSVFVAEVSTANTVAFVLFIIGFLLQGFLSNFGIPLVYDPSTSPLAVWIFRFYAPFNFGKAIYDISVLAFPVFDATNGVFVPGPGFNWSDMYNGLTYTGVGSFIAPPLIDSIAWLWIDFGIFFFLAWYLDNVLKEQGGVQNKPYFFLLPSWWGCSANRSGAHSDTRDLPEHADSDVVKESELAMSDTSQLPVRILGLTKTYSPAMCNSDMDVKAVRGLYLTVAENSVLCLLGHNGAGKTTTINILTGNEEPTRGDAILYGYSVNSDMSAIRSIMGVCPQHDVLWEELTSHEHLLIFGSIRGMTWAEARYASVRGLADVFLTASANVAAGAYSGGMKRRLSVAIACIGDPKIVCMDEPTTGLDPVARHEVWQVVQHIKTGRAIILTTHDMFEADVLADRIAIMSAGTLRCVGNALHLKNKFGKGYRLTVLVPLDVAESDVVAAVTAVAPSATLEASTAGSLTFAIPLASVSEVTALSQALETKRIPHRDWGVSHTSLEDVFLTVSDINPHGTDHSLVHVTSTSKRSPSIVARSPRSDAAAADIALDEMS